MESPRLFPQWLSALALVLSFITVDSIGTKIHEHMTSQELQSVFHVDHPSLVPEYHLVQLTHHLSRRHVGSSHPSNTLPSSNGKVPHEKHQEPKTNKWKVEKNPPSLLNDQMFINAKNNIKDVDIIGDLNDTVQVHFSVSESSDSENYSEGKPILSEDENNSTENTSDIEELDDREHIIDEQEDGTHKINLEAFGKKLELVLRKQEGLVKKDGLKMWNVLKNETQPHGVDYEEMESGDEADLGELFQDEASGAALLIRRDPKNQKLVVDGSIGLDLVIRPIPDSMAAAAALDDEMFLDPANMEDMVSIDTGLPLARRRNGERERIRRALAGAGHVIIKRDPSTGDHHGDYAFMEPDHMSKRYRRRRSTDEQGGKSRGKRDAPYVIYPEILVIVDYDGYRLHGGDNVQIKRYFVSFWNGVDLRYKLLKGPRIRVSIAGIIISRGRDATPYLERNRVGRDAIDSAAALTDMGKYLFRERRLPVYDIAVAITKLDMCRRQYANDACNRGTAGFAYVGGACVVNKRLEKVNSVAIIEDTGGFSGIIVAAHEVGHLLGAVHDGSPPPSYLGGPGAEKCRWEDGFIMSDLRHTEKGFRWSPCSVQSFHHFLNGDTASCLYNSPHEDDSLPRVLPGRLLTLDAQCRKDRGTSACFKDERVCAQLFCFDAASGYCVAYRPAAEGSPCGDGQYCMNGRCIAENENIIPDYSQHTPSYVRPDTSPFYSANATSAEETTLPYIAMSSLDTTQNIYKNFEYTTKAPEYTIYTSPSPITTANPYKFFFPIQSTTKNPYNFHFEGAETKSTSFTLQSTSFTLPSTSVTTQHPYVYNKYSITSTKSPYDFKDFVTRRHTKTNEVTSPTSSTTEKSTTSNVYEKSSYKPYEKSSISYNPYEKSTTKPVKSGFFSKTDIDGFFNRSSPFYSFNKDNHVKSLYKIGTYYSQPKNDNAIRPDANSQQQVQVEPARLVYSFRSNLTDVNGNYALSCTGQDAYLRIECQTPRTAAINK